MGKLLATPFTLIFDAANAVICGAAGEKPRSITAELYNDKLNFDPGKDIPNAFKTIGKATDNVVTGGMVSKILK